MNILENLTIMITGSNFRELDNGYLFILDFMLFAIINTISTTGTLDVLDFTLDHNIRQLFWSAYGVAMSFAIRWFAIELYTKFKAWRRKKQDEQ